MSLLLPEILAARNDGPGRVLLTLSILPELAYFSGHFLGLPLLPGVVQVDWATHFGRSHLQAQGRFISLDNLKFQSMIFPGTTVELLLDWQPDLGRLSFIYTQKGQPMSSGRICFDVQGPE